MKKNIKVLSSVAILSFLLTACGGGNPTSEATSIGGSEFESQEVTSTPSSEGEVVSSNDPVSEEVSNPTSYEDISVGEVEDYDAYCDTWSEANHLYIHYFREDAKTFADYEKYGLWLWEPGKAGVLFAAASNPGNMHVSTSSWMQKIGNGGNVDQAGVCADIDLSSKDYVTGQTGSSVDWNGIDRLGYLVVKLESMKPGNVGWEKDGVDNYFENIQVNKRENGSIHVFLVAKSTENYRHFYNEEIYVNPVNSDTTGKYRSQADIANSSAPFNKKVTTSKKFYENAGVGYEIFVPSFRDSDGDGMGDLRGVIDSLDYLNELNVKVIWLSPFLECNSYHGYDTINYFNVDPRFGTNETLDELIFKAHQKGMYILMDFVINHSSNQSIWFKKARRGEVGLDRFGNEINYRDLFHFKFAGDKTEKGIAVENDPNWIRDGQSSYYYYAKFADNMPEFNYDYSGTRNMMTDVAKYYLGKGIDGFRLDAIKHIYMRDESKVQSGDIILEDVGTKEYYDEEMGQMQSKEFDYSTNQNKNIAFWKEFAYELKSTYPDCYLVGENFDGWDQRIAPMYQAMDSQFDFPLFYSAHNWLYANIGGNATVFGQKMNAKFDFYAKYRSDYINAAFTSNHDVSRAINHINSTKDSEAGTEHDVKITGSMSQVNKAKVYAAVTMLQPGLSFIYYGDELGMSSNTKENEFSHENNLDRYYRQSFKWDDEALRPELDFGSQYTNAYDSYNSKLPSMEDQAKDNNSMLSFYKGLCAVKQDPTFPVNGKYTAYKFDDNEDVLHYIMQANSATTKDYKVYIHTGGNNGGSSSLILSIPETDEIVFSYNYNTSSAALYPYGVVVTRAK